MNQWTDAYEDDYLKERIQLVMQTQKNLSAQEQVLCSTYEQLWLPTISNLPNVEYVGQERYNAPYGSFAPPASHPFHGALAFSPRPGADLPAVLGRVIDWQAAVATLDLTGRMARIEVGETAITFTAVNINLKPHELLRDLNRELARAGAGAYLWKIEPLLESAAAVEHLYPDGAVPVISNAHTRADVSGYALLSDRPHLHTLIYAGLAAHKTSVESIWASLIRGRAAASMRGVSLVADGDIKLLSTPLPEFGVVHAGILVRKALPGGWEASDDCAYALVFEAGDVEGALQKLTVKRLQESLAFPVPDEWARTIWDHALDAGHIQRLETGGDCRGGVRIDLTRDWQALVQSLLEQQLVSL
jgi:hypothetical protein